MRDLYWHALQGTKFDCKSTATEKTMSLSIIPQKTKLQKDPSDNLDGNRRVHTILFYTNTS